MPKPKAEIWLREAFRDGVDERVSREAPTGRRSRCWLARHDPRRRPCSGRLERFHFIGRQRVERALGDLLPIERAFAQSGPEADLTADLILLAAWDPRNGGVACEGHHRRLDSHAGPELKIPLDLLPPHVLAFARDWGLESSLEERFPSPRRIAPVEEWRVSEPPLP